MGSPSSGAISRRSALLIGEEYISRHGSAKKARKCEAFVARAALPGRPSGGETGGQGRWRLLEALGHSVSPSPPPFCSVSPGRPDGRRQGPEPPRVMRCGHE